MLEIIPGNYLTVTPYGAWRAVSRAEDSPRAAHPAGHPEGSHEAPAHPRGGLRTDRRARRGRPHAAARPAERRQHGSWSNARSAPLGTLETTLPEFLAQLSDSGQAVLAGSMGFCLAMTGYPQETGEALAALGADMLSVAERQSAALAKLGDHLLDGWGNVDAAGISGLGFWPMRRPHPPRPDRERAPALQPASLRRPGVGPVRALRPAVTPVCPAAPAQLLARLAQLLLQQHAHLPQAGNPPPTARRNPHPRRPAPAQAWLADSA